MRVKSEPDLVVSSKAISEPIEKWTKIISVSDAVRNQIAQIIAPLQPVSQEIAQVVTTRRAIGNEFAQIATALCSIPKKVTQPLR